MAEVPSKDAVRMILERRAPVGLRTGVIQLGLAQTQNPVQLPGGLRCYSLSLTGQPLTALPSDLEVEYKLDLTDCVELTELPRNLKVSTLILTNCKKLASLPEGLQVNFLQLDGCISLRTWPDSASVTSGWVRAHGCSSLQNLPENLGPLASLDIRGCRRIKSIPPSTSVVSSIDIGGTAITSFPETLAGVALRWKGVPVTGQIAFFPETLKGPDVLAEQNAELRRVMIERMGFEKFLKEVDAQLIDSDRDPGGERKLLRVTLAGDEPMVVVSVICPSTGRQYVIRVPPATTTCHQAVAWTAGFDNPDDYKPVAET
ncbi:MAG: hypothetical protein JWR26_3107 [Pedosphaera sp.]|nr:hypothetical protein [Pedosphaera sp.]